MKEGWLATERKDVVLPHMSFDVREGRRPV
jgi:hypothetical protein